jgi:8-oxo-dGTP pyrophosphatase MutT (NUDIX family)
MDKWNVLESTYILRRKWMDIRSERVELSSGHVIDEFHVVEYPDWVCVLCLAETGDAVLVRQYRHGIGQTCLELPAGVIEPNEDIGAAAVRELREETGFVSTDWIDLGFVAPEPHRHTNRAHLRVAMNARREGIPVLDESEQIEVELLALSQLSKLVFNDAFNHSVHLALLLRAHARGVISI